MSLNAPCTTRSPIAGISEQADLPTVVRKLDLARSRTPTAFRGAPGYAGSGKADPDGLYLKHLAEAARAGRDAVARDGGQVRLAWHSRLPSR